MTYQLRNIVIAVVLGLLAVVFTTIYVTNYRKHVQQSQQSVSVVVATQDIPAGTTGAAIIAGHMLKVETVPRDALTPGAISSPNQISQLVSTDETLQGEQVSTRRFGNSAELGVRAQLKGTMRAIEIAAVNPDQVLAGTLRDGDHVDFIANLVNEGGTNGSSVHYTRIVLRNLLVLRAPQATDVKGSVATSQQATVMLAMTDTQTSKFFWAVKNSDENKAADGGWSLELRPVGNAADSTTNAEDFKTVLLDGLSAGQRARINVNGQGFPTGGANGGQG